MEFGRIRIAKEEELYPTDATTIKCSRCFSRQVNRVCHHCGAYLCERCEPQPIKLLRKMRLYKFLFKDREFFELHELSREFRLTAHCSEHIHYAETVYHCLIWMIVGFGAIGGIASWLLRFNMIVSLGFWALATVAFFFLLPTRGWVYRSFLGNSLPGGTYLFLPTKYKIDVTESITADFWVDNPLENYLEVKSTVEGINGKLTVKLSPVPGHYVSRKKLEIANNQSLAHFSAGYIGLDNLEQVIFKQHPVIKLNEEYVGQGAEKINHQGKLCLRGTLSASALEQVYQDQVPIEFEQPYEIREKAGWVGPKYDQEFPLWFVPNLSLAHRELIISIYMTPEIQGKSSLEHLSLQLPDEVSKDGIEIQGLLSTTTSEVYWVKSPLQEPINPFSIKFREPLPRNIPLLGKYEITIDNFLLSALKIESNGHLWFANGEAVPVTKKDEKIWVESVSKKTRLTGTFCFNTSIFEVQ